MNQGQVADLLKRYFERDFLKVLQVLRTEMAIPETLAAHPGELRAYVNGSRLLDFRFGDDFVFGHQGRGAFGAFDLDEAACYKPFLPAISISTEVLENEAKAAQIAPEALLEILVFHEMVHIAMMGHLVDTPDARDWIADTNLRFIHEACALKACEFCFEKFFETASVSDISKYIAYIQTGTAERPEHVYYHPYFEKLRHVSLPTFWSTVVQDILENPALKNVYQRFAVC